MSVVAQVVKKFINDPETVVPEALAGMAAAHPGLVRVDLGNQLVLRAEAPVQGKVGLVSGGGSGHEPLHGGLVGLGMLDAACAGAVFTSPVPDQMAAATRAVEGGAARRERRDRRRRRRAGLALHRRPARSGGNRAGREAGRSPRRAGWLAGR